MPGSPTADSAFAELESINAHLHGEGMCYPTLAGGVTVADSGGVWTLGAFVEVVPASTITNPYSLHFLNVEALDTDAVYELHLFQGGADTLVCKRRLNRNSVVGFGGLQSVKLQTPVIPANARVRAKLASSVGGASGNFALQYHEHT